MEASDATVIIVEDNADNLFIVTDLLTAEANVGTVHGCASGQQLFELLGRIAPPNLILLDLQIPRDDGYAILRRLREDPRTAGVRAAALTANVMTQDVEQCRAAGFIGFIGKPIDMDRFPQQIQRILSGQEVWEPR